MPRPMLTLAVCSALIAAAVAVAAPSSAAAAPPRVADWPLNGAVTAGSDTTYALYTGYPANPGLCLLSELRQH